MNEILIKRENWTDLLLQEEEEEEEEQEVVLSLDNDRVTACAMAVSLCLFWGVLLLWEYCCLCWWIDGLGKV